MRIPIDSLLQTIRFGSQTRKDSDSTVRVAVYLDESVTPFIVSTVRDALVPQTTSALVRVERLRADPVPPRDDTDVVLVLTCGSSVLERAVHELVVAGAPVAVIAESSVEVPFIEADTPMLGLITATDAVHLLDTLAHWILERTDKAIAFASNFPFMRIAAANRVIASCALTNMVTGALVFIPGADFPAMALSEIHMVVQLSAIFGYRLEAERTYEVAGVLAAGILLRGVSRAACRALPHAAFIIKAAIALAGTYGMGKALVRAYEHGIDYEPLNEAVSAVLGRARNIVASRPAQSDQPISA